MIVAHEEVEEDGAGKFGGLAKAAISIDHSIRFRQFLHRICFRNQLNLAILYAHLPIGHNVKGLIDRDNGAVADQDVIVGIISHAVVLYFAMQILRSMG